MGLDWGGDSGSAPGYTLLGEGEGGVGTRDVLRLLAARGWRDYLLVYYEKVGRGEGAREGDAEDVDEDVGGTSRGDSDEKSGTVNEEYAEEGKGEE